MVVGTDEQAWEAIRLRSARYRRHTARQLAPGIELAGFRIVQEALTNTLRRAGPATAAVRLRYAERMLEIEVVDDGRGGPVNGRGHG